MKKTPLTHIHAKLGAKMVDFAGYEMPVIYSSINEEHLHVRNHVGVFDVSHMGEFFVEGEGALQLVNHVTSNDAAALTDGQAQYSCLPNNHGGIVDDLLVYRVNQNKFMLVVNASNMKKDWDWINQHNHYGAKLTDVSDDTCLLAVQGPKATEALQSLTDYDLSSLKYYTFCVTQFAGIDGVVVSATGYTGAGGFEIYAPAQHAEHIWNEVFKAGEKVDIKPIGLGARDTLRLEMGFCLYGNDINDETNPLEAGLGWITKLKKGHFVGSNIIQQVKDSGVSRKLVGFEMIDRGIPRKDYTITNAEGNAIGVVTSGTQSPSLNKAIGLGYVALDYAKPDTEIYIEIRGKLIKAKVCKLPFIQS